MSDALYAALRSHDPRFDGRFFVAVITTGIYCRPVCPARAPKRENIRFYPTAAAAESEGYRPCMRCRPETSAGTPAWSGTSATVARAMRIIDESNGIEHLASRLGITDRHLRRLFEEHVGAPPIAILQTRRLHLARSLLAETALSVTDIAYGSGFSSIRRFNDSIRKAYHCTPSELRRKRPAETERVTIRLPFRPPLRWDAMLSFLGSRAIEGVESFEEYTYVRGDIGIDRDQRMTVPPSHARDIQDLVIRARRMFDLAADPTAIAEHLRRDRILRPLVKPGTRVPGAWEPFEIAVRAVVGQQISVRAATTIMNRLAPMLTPQRLADADVGGMPRSRAETIRGLARAVADDPPILTRGGSIEETVEKLMALRGIGRWTAHYIAMRALSEPDAFPDSDLGLRKAAVAIGIAPNRLLEHAERWRPWRAYATMALWESL